MSTETETTQVVLEAVDQLVFLCDGGSTIFQPAPGTAGLQGTIHQYLLSGSSNAVLDLP
jgi:hypothetical protein